MSQVLEQPQTADNGGSTQAIARRQFNPLAPIGSASALKGLLEAQKVSIQQMLPKHITPERLFKTLLVAANRTPDLLKCTQASILETINRAAELGLDLSGTLGEAYPVPFNNKVKDANGNDIWVSQCQLIIGYRGFAKLARQSGEIQYLDADVVCERDTFYFRKGSDAKCEFIPYLKGDRGEIIGAYAYVKFKDGGEQFDFMTVNDIEKVRMRSKSGSDRDGNAKGAWKTDWSEMAKKTVFRRVAKWLPLSTEKLVAVLEQDDTDFDAAKMLEVETLPRRGAQALADRLTAPATDPLGEPVVIPPAPESEEEANAVLEAAAAKAKQTDDAQPIVQEADSQVSDEEDQTTTQPAQDDVQITPAERLTANKNKLWAAMKTHGLKTTDMARLYGGAVLGIGKKGKEESITDEQWDAMHAEATAGEKRFAVK